MRGVEGEAGCIFSVCGQDNFYVGVTNIDEKYKISLKEKH